MSRHRPDDVAPVTLDDAPVPPAHRPTWWRVRNVRAIAFVLVGLAVALSLLSAYFSWQTAQSSAEQAAASEQRAVDVEHRLEVLEQDLADRSRQRDDERDRFTAYLCELLGTLPADADGLNRIRVTLGCSQPGQPSPSAQPEVPPAPSAPGPPSAPSSAPADPPPVVAPPPQDPPAAPGTAPVSPLCDLLPVLC